MGRLRRFGLTLASEVSWRLPGWPRRLLVSFSETERGSAVDMFAAAELTKRPEMRRKYFLHALDECAIRGVGTAQREHAPLAVFVGEQQGVDLAAVDSM